MSRSVGRHCSPKQQPSQPLSKLPVRFGSMTVHWAKDSPSVRVEARLTWRLRQADPFRLASWYFAPTARCLQKMAPTPSRTFARRMARSYPFRFEFGKVSLLRSELPNQDFEPDARRECDAVSIQSARTRRAPLR